MAVLAIRADNDYKHSLVEMVKDLIMRIFCQQHATNVVSMQLVLHIILFQAAGGRMMVIERATIMQIKHNTM